MIFDEWFKTTKWYTGDNCSPKYITYRSMRDSWFASKKYLLKDVSKEVERIAEDNYHSLGMSIVNSVDSAIESSQELLK